MKTNEKIADGHRWGSSSVKSPASVSTYTRTPQQRHGCYTRDSTSGFKWIRSQFFFNVFLRGPNITALILHIPHLPQLLCKVLVIFFHFIPFLHIASSVWRHSQFYYLAACFLFIIFMYFIPGYQVGSSCLDGVIDLGIETWKLFAILLFNCLISFILWQSLLCF